MTTSGTQQRTAVLVHRTGPERTARFCGLLDRAGYDVVLREPPVLVAGDLVVLLVTRELHAELDGLLAAVEAAGAFLLPVVLDEPREFGWGRLDELLYLDLRRLDEAAGDAAVARALDGARVRPARLPDGDFVFISYAFEDEAAAAAVEQDLEAAGIGTFRATGFTFGVDWVGLLDRAVREARLVLTLISPAYLDSFWCFEEFVDSPAERRVLVQIEPDAKFSGLRDRWHPVRVDLTGLPAADRQERLLTAVRAELAFPEGERAARAARERPPAFTTTSFTEYMSRVPWSDDLLERKLHPQLRVRPRHVGPGSSLRDRRQAARDAAAGFS